MAGRQKIVKVWSPQSSGPTGPKEVNWVLMCRMDDAKGKTKIQGHHRKLSAAALAFRKEALMLGSSS